MSNKIEPFEKERTTLPVTTLLKHDPIFTPAQGSLSEIISRINSNSVITIKPINYYNYQNHLYSVTYGSYPEYLEDHKTFILLPNQSVTFSQLNNIKFDEMTFSQAGFLEESEIQIKVNNVLLTNSKVASLIPRQKKDTTSSFYKNIERYWNVDDAQFHNSYWTKKHFSYNGTANNIEFKCLSQNGICFFSPPKLYTKGTTLPKNKILIFIDTLREDGINQQSSPFLSNLRENSINYLNAFAAGNMTSPSTNAVLSCQRPSHIEDIAFSYSVNSSNRNKFYQRNQPSFTHYLSSAGWNTAAIGNISVLSSLMDIGIDHGFENHISIEPDGYDTVKIARSATQWISRNYSNPFFLYVHFHAPHAPYKPPFSDLFSTYQGYTDLLSYHSILKWLYRGEIHHTDRYVKLIFETLKELNLLSETEVIITSDHGEHHISHHFRENEISYGKTGAYFDHGATMRNDEVKIPLFIHGVDEPKKVETFVSNLDIAPTLLTLAHLKKPEWCDGVNLLNDQIIQQSRTIGIEGFREKSIIIDNRYKYIKAYESTEKTLHLENSFSSIPYAFFSREIIYDLQGDPNESTNLALENGPLLSKARIEFDRYYNTKYHWNIILTSPVPTEMEIQLPINTEILNKDDLSFEIKSSPHATIIKALNSEALIIELGEPLTTKPYILIGKNVVNLYSTNSRINLNLNSDQLPVEYVPDKISLKGYKNPQAFIIKSEPEYQSKKIVAGNPEFEAVLREWGYINDK